MNKLKKIQKHFRDKHNISLSFGAWDENHIPCLYYAHIVTDKRCKHGKRCESIKYFNPKCGEDLLIKCINNYFNLTK